MTTQKILLTGLSAATTEKNILAWLGQFGPVQQVDIIRDGDADHPVVIVEMGIGSEVAANLVSRLNDYWHEGNLVSARLLHH
jgi:hypothetical protein